MFDAEMDFIENDRVTRYRLSCDGVPMTYSMVLDLWSDNAEFRGYFTNLLADSPFTGYRWETPVLTLRSVAEPFEFVLLNSPGFCSRQTDAKTYAGYFTHDDTDGGVVTFANLRGDATLIVPSPQTDEEAYGHLAAFIRRAPSSQLDAFWQTVGVTTRSQVCEVPRWLNTAGGGVAWLHVRIDSRPKYYGYSPYKRTELKRAIGLFKKETG